MSEPSQQLSARAGWSLPRRNIPLKPPETNLASLADTFPPKGLKANAFLEYGQVCFVAVVCRKGACESPQCDRKRSGASAAVIV